MGDSDTLPKVRETESRRLSDKVWDIGLKLVCALMGLLLTISWGKLEGTEKRVTALEIQAAATTKESSGFTLTLKEIKDDIREIKNDLKARRNP